MNYDNNPSTNRENKGYKNYTIKDVNYIRNKILF